jgi:hypothetical protein
MSEVKHFGVFEFQPEVTAQQVNDCFSALKGMVGKIPGLEEVLCGPYESDEGLNDGFTHGFVMTFESPEARDAYLPHPEHELVKDLVLPRLARIIVFDFQV